LVVAELVAVLVAVLAVVLVAELAVVLVAVLLPCGVPRGVLGRALVARCWSGAVGR
jgi:hypothetical protein